MVKKLKWCLLTMLCCLTYIVQAQLTGRVKGSVLSETGDVLSGVSIAITQAGSKEGQSTTTNEKGIFVVTNLKAGTKYNFTFSYVESVHIVDLKNNTLNYLII